jgi:hypothetical protein
MTKVRYRVFAMNFLACLINYGDRIAMSVAAPLILDEFDFSPAVWGVILSAFFWTYFPFALDQTSRRRQPYPVHGPIPHPSHVTTPHGIFMTKNQ